jgi:LemA protein
MRHLLASLVLVLAVATTGCGYNALQTQDEAVTAAWSEVVNQYQRRADLIPNLVNTVKGFAAQEESFVGVAGSLARDFDSAHAGMRTTRT